MLLKKNLWFIGSDEDLEFVSWVTDIIKWNLALYVSKCSSIYWFLQMFLGIQDPTIQFFPGLHEQGGNWLGSRLEFQVLALNVCDRRTDYKKSNVQQNWGGLEKF